MLRISLMLITIDNQVINRLKDLMSLLNLSVFSPSCIMGESYNVMQASSDDCYVFEDDQFDQQILQYYV